jgi:hypothetical protein
LFSQCLGVIAAYAILFAATLATIPTATTIASIANIDVFVFIVNILGNTYLNYVIRYFNNFT